MIHDPCIYMFSYGMNTNLVQMALRCNQPYLLGVGTLYKYQFNFRYHADIHYTGNANDVVHGVVWELDPDDLDTIDALEGFPNYYTRELVEVDVHRYMPVKAWAYEMREKGPLRFPDMRYQDCVMEGYQQNGIPIPQIHNALDRCGSEIRLMERNHAY